MDYKTFLLIKTSVLVIAGLTGANAQSTLSSGSGNATAGGASISYTVGQMVYVTNNGTQGSVTPGIQQPPEKLKITGFAKSSEFSFTSTAYPNPTGDILQLKIEGADLQGFNYFLFNVAGVLKKHGMIESAGTGIDMSLLAPATYFLKVTNGHQELMLTYKIIKK